MAKYSDTMLATVASLQKRQRKPKVVYQKALLSHLYPFYHYEKSNVTIENGLDKIFDTKDTSKESSNLYLVFNFEMYNALKEITIPVDSIENASSFNIDITAPTTNWITHTQDKDSVENSSSFDINVTVETVLNIDMDFGVDSIENKSTFNLQIAT